MTDLNDVRLKGNVTKFDTYETGNSIKLSFSLAVEGTRYDSQKREKVIATTFVSVERWVSGDVAPEDWLYPGDRVYVMGELSIYKKDGEQREHTRVAADLVQVLRRGRQGAEALAAGGRPAPPPQTPPPADPWAPQSGTGAVNRW